MPRANRLELGLLCLEYTVKLGSEHDVALDLQLARHECLLAVDLAVSHVHEGCDREREGSSQFSVLCACVSVLRMCYSLSSVQLTVTSALPLAGPS